MSCWHENTAVHVAPLEDDLSASLAAGLESQSRATAKPRRDKQRSTS